MPTNLSALDAPSPADLLVRVRLIRKLANRIDGVDISQNRAGDILLLPVREARLLIAEGWAVPCEADGKEERRTAGVPHGPSRAGRPRTT